MIRQGIGLPRQRRCKIHAGYRTHLPRVSRDRAMLKAISLLLLIVPGACIACDSLQIEDSTRRSTIQATLDCLTKENAEQAAALANANNKVDEKRQEASEWKKRAGDAPRGSNGWTRLQFSSVDKCLLAAQIVLTQRGYKLSPVVAASRSIVGTNEATVAWIICGRDNYPVIVVESNSLSKQQAYEFTQVLAAELDNQTH